PPRPRRELGRGRVRVNRPALLRVPALGELLDELRVERREVVGLPAGDEPVVDHDLLVHPLASRVADVGLKRGPRGTLRPRTPPDSTSIHGPWQITPTGLFCAKKSRTNWNGILVRPHRVRVADAARDDERVVVVGPRLLDRPVDLERVGLVVVVEALDLAFLE